MWRVGFRRFQTIGLVILTTLAAHGAQARPAAPESNEGKDSVQPGAGLYLKMPDHWVALPEGSSTSKSPQPDDPGLQPLMVLAKYEASHPGFNPKIRIFFQPIPADSLKLTPRELIQLVLPKAKGTFSTFQIEHPARDLTISGLPAADMSWLYTLPMKSGPPLPLRTRIVIIRQGDHFYTVGVSSPREGPDDVRTEFQTFLDRMLIGQVPR
jgi:hypothetical protein